MTRLQRLRATLQALRDHDPPEAEEPERLAAADLRAQADQLHREVDQCDDQQLREGLTLEAIERWAAADALVPEERVR